MTIIDRLIMSFAFALWATSMLALGVIVAAVGLVHLITDADQFPKVNP